MRGVRLLLAVVLLAAGPAGLAGCRSAEGQSERRSVPPRGCVADVVAGERGPGCRGVRVRFPNPQFVPQGLALGAGRTAYLSGYDYEPEPGHRECQVVQVARRTGRVLAFADMLWGEVPGVGRQFCRHGGGITLTSHGLWVAGATRLWLLDPAALGSADPVRRVWVVDERIRASTIAATDDELVLGFFRERRRGAVLRFDLDAVVASGTTTLVLDEAGAGELAPAHVRHAPSHLQGLTLGPHGLWAARSTSYCGELVSPSRDRIPFVPGAEGIAFDDAGHLWVASESGSRPYQRMGGRPDVPTLARVDPQRLDRRDPAACW